MSAGSHELIVFCPCFRITAALARRLAQQFRRLQGVLKESSIGLRVLWIDDGSPPESYSQLRDAAQDLAFLSVQRREQNLGNAATVLEAHRLALSLARPDVQTWIGCCDADGEHDPLLFCRAIDLMQANPVDLVLGNIRYPHPEGGHDAWADFYMMKALAAEQSEALKLSSRLDVPSPGFQLHTAASLQKALIRFDAYMTRYEERYGVGPLGRWGMHFLIAQLAVNAGARAAVLDLPCYGPPPNRSAAKRREQFAAAIKHLELLEQMG